MWVGRFYKKRKCTSIIIFFYKINDIQISISSSYIITLGPALRKCISKLKNLISTKITKIVQNLSSKLFKFKNTDVKQLNMIF